MIAFVRGRVAALTLNAAVIDVGGVGYHVFCTPGTIAGLRLGAETQLATSMVVREDSNTLYGFADVDERDMFELVQTASGVGPKVAQAMLAVLPPERLRQAIANADHAALTSVPGIGRKGAERIVVELKDRVGPPVTTTATGGSAWRDQVRDALQGLGWSARDAEHAVDTVAADTTIPSSTDSDGTGSHDVPTLLRAALRTLSKA
jgi:Holliday junction DNA helicase RuvA